MHNGPDRYLIVVTTNILNIKILNAKELSLVILGFISILCWCFIIYYIIELYYGVCVCILCVYIYIYIYIYILRHTQDFWARDRKSYYLFV